MRRIGALALGRVGRSLGVGPPRCLHCVEAREVEDRVVDAVFNEQLRDKRAIPGIFQIASLRKLQKRCDRSKEPKIRTGSNDRSSLSSEYVSMTTASRIRGSKSTCPGVIASKKPSGGSRTNAASS
eukprot:4203545-Pleurochrysis_carterae.AAC.1